jgi:hypothetical protein
VAEAVSFRRPTGSHALLGRLRRRQWSGAPVRLDYLVKIGTLRRMSGAKLGLEPIALSIISLGIVDAIAFLPLSISATATSSESFRLPLMESFSSGLRPAAFSWAAGTWPACRSSFAARSWRS